MLQWAPHRRVNMALVLPRRPQGGKIRIHLLDLLMYVGKPAPVSAFYLGGNVA